MFFVFFNDAATTEIYTLSLHDALPISIQLEPQVVGAQLAEASRPGRNARSEEHTSELQSRADISHAVFCLKKKTQAQAARHGGSSPHAGDTRRCTGLP